MPVLVQPACQLVPPLPCHALLMCLSMMQPVLRLNLINLSAVVSQSGANRLPSSHVLRSDYTYPPPPPDFLIPTHISCHAKFLLPSLPVVLPAHYSHAPLAHTPHPPTHLPPPASGFTSAWIFYAFLMSAPRCEVDKRGWDEPTRWWRSEGHSNFQPKGKRCSKKGGGKNGANPVIFLAPSGGITQNKTLTPRSQSWPCRDKALRVPAWNTGTGIMQYWIS